MISKRTESSIQLSHVTLEYHLVRPKWYLCLWYIRRKPCNYLASRIVLYQMNWLKHPLELRHLGVLSGASKTISEPMVCLALSVHLSCIDTNTIFKWTKTRFYMTHVTLEFHRRRPKRFLRIWYVHRKPCTYLASRLALYQMNWIKHPLELYHLGVLSGASKTISKPTVYLAQTMHLSWTDTNTISKWNKTRFHMTHIT
jgi:hypothetical protein